MTYQPTCGDCRFLLNRHSGGGQCHRFPPSVHVFSVVQEQGPVWQTERPWVGDAEFCGEHQAAPITDDTKF